MTPFWLTRILFGGAYCVKGPRAGVNINVGANLISPDDAQSGDGKFQEYYSLSRAVVAEDKWHLVWAVCGGAGASLPDGMRVVVGPSLPASQLQLLRNVMSIVEAEEEEHEAKLRAWNRTNEPDTKAIFEQDLRRIEEAIDTQLALLRASVMNENTDSLKSGASSQPSTTTNKSPAPRVMASGQPAAATGKGEPPKPKVNRPNKSKKQ